MSMIYLQLHTPEELLRITIIFGIALLFGLCVAFLQYLNKPSRTPPEIERYKTQTAIKGKRILIVSDLHYSLSDEEKAIVNQKFDQCWILGDINEDIIKELNLKSNCEFYAVSGNHETPETFKKIEGIQDVHGTVVQAGDYTIGGISGSSQYKERTPYCMWPQKTSREIADAMPKCDILISHDSPYQKHSQSLNKEGLQGITFYIERNQPKLHIYGHHHLFADYKIGETQCICNYRLGIIGVDGVYHTV